MKVTLLDFLLKNGYSKKEIKIFLMTGKIFVNQQKVNHSLIKIDVKNDVVDIKKNKRWVSRGAFKLLKALETFKIDLQNKVVLDIGASTGGFTEVCLEYGAKKVYALDVGTNQIDYKLRMDQRIIVMEKTNLKTINAKMFDDKIDIVVVDVSFISLYHVFQVIEKLTQIREMIVLIKPQFEAFKDEVINGYVDLSIHQEIITRVIMKAQQFGFEIINIIKCPIKGLKAKNIEYLALVRKKV